MTDEEPPLVEVKGNSQGGQVGDHNVQVNMWLHERQIDARRVEHLGAHAAAEYVAELSAEDAGFVLAIAPAGPSARVLRVLLLRKKELTMALLQKMNKDKAQELLEALGPDAAGLMRLPEAAEAIANLEDA